MQKRPAIIGSVTALLSVAVQVPHLSTAGSEPPPITNDRTGQSPRERLIRSVNEFTGLKEDLVSAFLQMAPSDQRALLEDAGLVVPPGPLADPSTQQYLLGQWLSRNGDTATGDALIWTSGLASPTDVKDVSERTGSEAFVPTDQEIEDTRLAGTSDASASSAATLQKVATGVRGIAAQEVVGLLGVWVDDDENQLVVAATDTASAEAFAQSYLSAVPVRVQASNRSEQQLVRTFDALRNVLTTSSESGNWIGKVDKLSERVVMSIDSEDAEALHAVNDWLVAHESLSGDVDVQVLERGQLPAAAQSVWGGRAATSCTWGFSVVGNNSGLTRLATAAHCGNTQAWGGINRPFIRECRGNAFSGCPTSESDAQVHELGSDVGINEIYTDAGYRDITARVTWDQMDLNDVVCLQGKTTGAPVVTSHRAG